MTAIRPARSRSSVLRLVPRQSHGIVCGADLSRTQLHQALADATARRERLQAQLHDVQAALAQACAELARTQRDERAARHLALHDSLTELPNRRRFCERLDQILAAPDLAGWVVAVLYLDLDGFKPINDRHGHHVGDQLLRVVAQRLGQAVRAQDLVSRLGGDEFACLMLAERFSRPQLALLAGKLFDAVAAPVQLDQLQLSVPPSIGIAFAPVGCASTDRLLRQADAAMYQAKQRGTRFEFAAEIG